MDNVGLTIKESLPLVVDILRRYGLREQIICPTGITTHNRRLQRELNPLEKARRVANYVARMEKEVGVIAYSCGVANPRALRRYHCRIVQADGRSIPMNELYPDIAETEFGAAASCSSIEPSDELA